MLCKQGGICDYVNPQAYTVVQNVNLIVEI